MVRSREEMEQLIATYLNGEAGPEQAMELEDWKLKNRENQALFDALEKTHGLTQKTKLFKDPDQDEAWRKVQTHLKTEPKVIPLWRRPSFMMGAVAVLVLAFLLGAFWNRDEAEKIPYAEKGASENEFPQTTVLLASDKVALFTLEDQSKVKLENGSRLTLASDYNKNGRSSELKGSGTFEVIHDQKNPFIVNVEGLQVVDVGTIFSIRTKGDTVKIVVDEGAVELRVNGRTLDVVAGDSAFYVISHKLISRYKSPESRQDHIFEFDGTNLEEVASILSQFFNRKIVVMDEAIKKCPVSVTFKNEDLATILDIIKELLDVKVIRNKDIIGIYGTGCN